LARKYPNLSVDTSAYAFHRLPEALVACMRGAGYSRVMFGANWPTLSPKPALEKRKDFALDDKAQTLFLGGKARHVFRLAA
jgi:predicted TIM-barrel fold metal-dependent hydrolase